MTTIDYDALESAAYEAGLGEDAIRTGYSGRAMYGKTCLGIVHDSVGELLRFILALDHAGLELDWIGDARQDSMGRAIITYFPGVTVDGAPVEDKDDEEINEGEI